MAGRERDGKEQFELADAHTKIAATEPAASSALQARAPVRLSEPAERQEFFIPVSEFVCLFPEEVKIVNHPAFQRLGRIYQLGQTHLVYRGATHKRLEHALGALHIVQRMIEAVRHNSDKAVLRAGAAGAPLSKSEERFTRLGALRHDIGHIAAGHTIEDELGLWENMTPTNASTSYFRGRAGVIRRGAVSQT